ncbi:uncharacterized protein LOC119724132 [Patiria miniata]|uniref:Uncharacterized protein n=1 Tax=Patiria miniata TaxID=46514 RepID=A0A913ZIV3_PATMI|nr:uncharacterized protein LOC119724132 [Patiria miniata]
MSNAIGQISRIFLRHRSKSSNRETKTTGLDDDDSNSIKSSEGAMMVPVSTLCNNVDDDQTTSGELPAEEEINGDTAPPVAQQLEEEIERQRKALQREFDMERMHRELLHIEVEKLHMARENQLMNRQFMAVLKERRELDRERKEMIAAAVEVWRELSGNENFKSKKAHNVNEAISKALHQPASVTKIKEAEPRLLRRLRMCQNASEVRCFQADLKKKQEALFQLLLKSETMMATRSYHRPRGKDRGSKEGADKPKTGPPVPPKTAVKRSRLGDPKVGSPRPVVNPPPPPVTAPADQTPVANNLQPISEEGVNAPPTNERREDGVPANRETERSRSRPRNVLTWNLDVQGIRETAI